MNVKVSVIVPILNSIQYIEECIDSILTQSLKEIEVLMVDAGSVDGTLERLYEYEKKDSRCRVIHSDRKSCGYQDNLGVRLANGEYVAFVESDDMIVPQMYAELYDLAKAWDLDFVKGDFDTFYYTEKGERIAERFRGVPASYYNKVLDTSRNPELLLHDMYIWKGIYKRDFLLKHEIWQNTTPGAAFQDVGFQMQTLSQAKRAYYTDKVYYQYRRDNAASSVYNKNGYIYLKQEFLFIEKFLERKPECSQFWMFFYKRLLCMIQTRDKIRVYSGVEWNEVEESLGEIADIFRRGILQGRIVPDEYGEPWLYEVNLLCRDLELYLKNVAFRHSFQMECWDAQLNRCLLHKCIVIFGCSVLNRRLFTILEHNHIAVAAFCDNSEEKQGELCCGIPVLSPEQAVTQLEDAIYLVPRKYAQPMSDQLNGLGISQTSIVVNDIGWDVASAFVYQYKKRNMVEECCSQ